MELYFWVEEIKSLCKYNIWVFAYFNRFTVAQQLYQKYLQGLWIITSVQSIQNYLVIVFGLAKKNIPHLLLSSVLLVKQLAHYLSRIVHAVSNCFKGVNII